MTKKVVCYWKLLFLFCFFNAFAVFQNNFNLWNKIFHFRKKSKQIFMTTAEVLSECICDDKFIVMVLPCEQFLFWHIGIVKHLTEKLLSCWMVPKITSKEIIWFELQIVLY